MHTVSTSRHRKIATRTAILDAAVQIFLERAAKRTDEVKLEDIARTAGVSRRSVYVNFGPRTGLLVAMVQHFDAAGILARLVQRVIDAPSSLEALDAVVHLHAEYSPVAYPIASVLMTGKHKDDALRAAWDDRMQARRSVYESVVQRLERDGVLSSEWNVRTATDILLALTSWQVWEQLVVDRGWSKQRYRRYLGTVLRQALIQRRPRPAPAPSSVGVR